ncbi:MAG: transposase [Chitinophagales bacterium]
MHFFTATINNWQKLLQDDKIKILIVQSLEWLYKNERAHTHGFVIMPNHIHLLWSRGNDYEIQKSEQDLLSFTGHEIKKYLTKNNPEQLNNFISTQADRAYHFWERRPRSIEIMSREIAWQKLNYIHNNPVKEKWQLAKLPEEYSYSSAAFYIKEDKTFSFLTHYMDYC